MSLQTENHTLFSEKRIHTVGVILIIFIAGMIVGVASLQLFDGGNYSASQFERVELKNANIFLNSQAANGSEPGDLLSQIQVLMLSTCVPLQKK